MAKRLLLFGVLLLIAAPPTYGDLRECTEKILSLAEHLPAELVEATAPVLTAGNAAIIPLSRYLRGDISAEIMTEFKRICAEESRNFSGFLIVYPDHTYVCPIGNLMSAQMRLIKRLLAAHGIRYQGKVTQFSVNRSPLQHLLHRHVDGKCMVDDTILDETLATPIDATPQKVEAIYGIGPSTTLYRVGNNALESIPEGDLLLFNDWTWHRSPLKGYPRPFLIHVSQNVQPASD